MSDSRNQLVMALHDALRDSEPASEREIQTTLASTLPGPTLIELGASFAPPDYPPPSLTEADRAALRPGDRCGDVCDGTRRSVDILWQSRIPIELKFVTSAKRRSSSGTDAIGYEVLRDFHRLERLTELRKGGEVFQPGEERYAVFVTDHPGYWTPPWAIESGPSEPEPFSLAEGRKLPSPYWVCYPQESLTTRWSQYRPFFLANWHERLEWIDGPEPWRILLQQIPPQPSLRNGPS